MPKYRVEVTSRVPKIYTAEVVIEAESEADARNIIEDRYEQDEIEFEHDVDDYDDGELTIDTIKEIEP